MKAVAAALILIAWYLAINPHKAHPQTPQPNLTISAGTAVNGGSGLVLSSDSSRPWKRFAVTSGSAGQWSIVSAEHATGDDGGIYFYTVTATAGTVTPGPVNPPPAPDTLPIDTLTASLATAAANIDAASLTAMAQGYDAVAQQIDAGAITSPTQLYLVTGVQILSLTADQRTAVQPVTTIVAAWLNAQQVAGKLDETKMPDYSRVLHAIAKAIRPVTMPKPATPKRGTEPAPAEVAEPKLAPPKPAGKSPCADGHCPAPATWRWGRRS